MWQAPKTNWKKEDRLDALIDLRRISQNLAYLIATLEKKSKTINTELVTDVKLLDMQKEVLEDSNQSTLFDCTFWDYESFIKKSRFENYRNVVNEICAICATTSLPQNSVDYLNFETLNLLESKILHLKEIVEQRNYKYILDFILGVQNVY